MIKFIRWSTLLLTLPRIFLNIVNIFFTQTTIKLEIYQFSDRILKEINNKNFNDLFSCTNQTYFRLLRWPITIGTRPSPCTVRNPWFIFPQTLTKRLNLRAFSPDPWPTIPCSVNSFQQYKSSTFSKCGGSTVGLIERCLASGRFWCSNPSRDKPKSQKQCRQPHCQTLGNKCECHSEMTIINRYPVSQLVWHT